jgi:hypothetical protein
LVFGAEELQLRSVSGAKVPGKVGVEEVFPEERRGVQTENERALQGHLPQAVATVFLEKRGVMGVSVRELPH